MNATARQYLGSDIRVSDAERDAVVAELGEHFQAGRLTSAELDERTGQALTARTGQDLAALTVDLPALSTSRTSDVGLPGRSPAWPGGFLRIAVCLAVIGLVVTAVAVPTHGRGAVFPWWLIPVGYVVYRLTRCRGSRPDANPD